MIYLLDANVLIHANRYYYRLNQVPEFWDWLVFQGESGRVKIPVEIYEEITTGTDDLADWAKQPEVKAALILDEETDPAIVSSVIDRGYASDLTDDEIEVIGRDPFLIAAALHQSELRCVVTVEISKPRRIRHNRHVPDVCQDFGIEIYDTFQFTRELEFSTSWYDEI